MTFPLTVADRTFDAPPALAAAVLDDARAGGGTIVEGDRPAAWLAAVHEKGALPRDRLVGLCAALVRTGEPAAIVEACTLARTERLHELAPLFPAALPGLDHGVLLTPDPHDPGRSVEDALLLAWASVVDTRDIPGFDDLVGQLRYAGLRAAELALFARVGTPDDLRAALPAILTEGLPVDDVALLARALVRGSEVAHAVCDAAAGLNASQRYAVWHAATEADPSLNADDTLRARWLVDEAAGERPVEGDVN